MLLEIESTLMGNAAGVGARAAALDLAAPAPMMRLATRSPPTPAVVRAAARVGGDLCAWAACDACERADGCLVQRTQSHATLVCVAAHAGALHCGP